MHTGEEFFSLNWQSYLALTVLVACYMILTFANRLPRMSAFKEFLDAINSAGGHIFILLLLTVWSIKIAMQFYYHLLALPAEQFDKASAIVNVGIAFVQGSLVGGFTAALLKTMSGGKANGTGTPAPDVQPDTLRVDVTPEK